jgi:hypothetical protein
MFWLFCVGALTAIVIGHYLSTSALPPSTLPAKSPAAAPTDSTSAPTTTKQKSKPSSTTKQKSEPSAAARAPKASSSSSKSKKAPQPPCEAADLHDRYDLRLVQLLTRHGARTPIRVVPNDADGLEAFRSLWKGRCGSADEYCDRGQLTELGVRQQHASGKRLRKRLIDRWAFVDPLFNPAQVTLRTSNFTRTRLSLAHLLRGLFPDSSLSAMLAPSQVRVLPLAEVIDPTHQQLPTHQDFQILLCWLLQETMYAEYEHCPMARLLFSRAKQDPPYVELMSSPEVKEMREAVAKAWNISDPASLPSLIGINDILTSRLAHNISTALSPALADAIDRIATLAFHHLLFSNDDLLRYSIGAFVSDLLRDAEHVRMGLSSSRLFVYSAHDTTITPLRAVLQYVTRAATAWSWSFVLTRVLHRVTPDEVWPQFSNTLEIQYYELKPQPPASTEAAASTPPPNPLSSLVRIVTGNDQPLQCFPLSTFLARLQAFTLPSFIEARKAQCVSDLPADVDPNAIPKQAWDVDL